MEGPEALSPGFDGSLVLILDEIWDNIVGYERRFFCSKIWVEEVSPTKSPLDISLQIYIE